MTRLTNTPQYAVFLKVETLLEQQRPLEALQALDKELSLLDADSYLQAVRVAYAKQAQLHAVYLEELEAAWRDYEGAVTELLKTEDRLELTPEAETKIRQLRASRESRLQAAWETCCASLQATPIPEPEPEEVT